MRIIKQHLEEWETKLNEYQKSIDKGLAEIQKCKKDLRQWKDEVTEALSKGRFIRDENRIILSAPEIIIGNVNRQGIAEPKPGKIILRGNCIQVEATERIENRSPKIHTIAEDTGCDGTEHTLHPNGEIVQIANNLLFRSISHTDTLCPTYDMAVQPGLTLVSDGALHIKAEMPCETEESTLDQAITDLNTQKDALTNQITNKQNEIGATKQELDNIIAPQLNASELLTRAQYVDLDEQHQAFNEVSGRLYNQLVNYHQLIDSAIEVNRRMKGLEERKKKAGERKAQFKEESTNASLNLTAEKINLVTRDGDNNIRTNDQSGIYMQTRNMTAETSDDTGKLIEDSLICMHTGHAIIDTHNPNYTNEEGDGEYKATGSIELSSKDVQIRSIDYDLKKGKLEEKELTPESGLTVQTGTINLTSVDTEGKATGLINLNAKDIRLRSMDLDKENRTDVELAKESRLQLLSETLFIGSTEEKELTKLAQVTADEVKLFGKTTTELQQDEDKGLVEMTEGNVMINGEAVDVYGKFTSNGESTIPTLKSTSMEADHMKVNSSWQTPKTQEGVSAPASPDKTKKKSKSKLKLFGK
ncbi:MAG: hypothetical protein ACI30I_08720 [Parabacteroides sp.]